MASVVIGRPREDAHNSGASNARVPAEEWHQLPAWLRGHRMPTRNSTRPDWAPGRVPTFFEKPVACLDKILLFVGAVLSSLLFAVHNMLSSPWDLIYVAAGCLLLPVILFLIIQRKAETHPRPRKDEDTYKVYRKWARTTYGEGDSTLLDLLRFRIEGARSGGKARLECLGPAGSCRVAADKGGDSCVCCLSDFEAGDALAVLPCGHMFCEACVVSWSFSGRAASRHCPVCRADYRARRIESA